MSLHVHGRPDNEDEWLDDTLGRGSGDGDMFGYPGQTEPEIKSKYASYGGTVHGLIKVHSAEYRSWKSMRQRCSNPNSKDYPRYGGRDIKVCERWNDFAKFIQDMGSRPSEKYSIERIDNNGDYEPSNCRWATQSEQQNNKSRNGPSVLNHEIAIKIRELHARGWNQFRLSELFMVSKQTISDIVNHNYYKEASSSPKAENQITLSG